MLKSSKSESVEDIDILCYKEKLKKLNCRELDYYTWNVINLTNKSGIIPLSQREQETLEEVLSSKLGKKVEKIKEIENFVDELKRQNKNLESKEVEIKTILKETDINTFENDFDKYKETDKRIIYIMEEDLKSKSDSNDALTHVYTIYVNFKSKIIYSIDSNEDQIFFTDWINSEEKFKENIKDFVFIENVVKQQGFYTCYLHAIETATYIAQNLFLVDKFLKQINLYHDKKEDEKSVSYLADPAYDDEIKQKFKLHIFNETLPIGLEQSLVSTGKMHKILQNDPSKMAQYRKSIDRSINKISKNDLKNDILKRNPGYLRISTRHKMDKKGIQFCSKMNFERLCWIYRLYSKEVMENDSYKKIKIPVMYDDIFKSSFLPLATV